MTRIGIIGLGLIGGSLALAARRAGHDVTAWDADAATREEAARGGVAVLADLSGAELIVLAVPMPDLTDALASTLAAVGISDSATITDVGSLKQPVVDAMRAAGVAERYVPGHPMAGTEHSGFGAASPDLFVGRRWALCLDSDHTDVARWLQVAAVITSLGAHVLPLLPSEHDSAMAMVSGLPHLLALALASSARDSGALVWALAAGSFADLTRVAASSPALLRAVTEQNEPAVRAALRRLEDQLDQPWGDLIKNGHEARKSLVSGGEGDRPAVEKAAAAGTQELLALGRTGTVIVAVDPATSKVWHRSPVAPPQE